MARRSHNLRQIEKFLIFYDNLFPSTVGFFSVEEMQGKPQSSPPIPDSDRVWDFLEHRGNRDAALYLKPIFEQMKREVPPLWYIAGVVAGWVRPLIEDDEPDHGRLRRWKAGETDKDRAGAELFERAVHWIEERLNHLYPNLEINVSIPKKDEPLQGLVHQRNIDNNSLRSQDARDAYKLIDADIKQIIEEQGCTVKAAIGLYRDRLERANEPGVSVRKCQMARAYVKREKEIEAIVKEKGCSVESAIDLHEMRKEAQVRGGAT